MPLIKIRSGALQFAVFIGVLIALLLSGLILYVYTYIYIREQSVAGEENIRYADSGINYLLTEQSLSLDTTSLKLNETENQQVFVHISQWGLFRKAYVKTIHRKKKFEKCSLLGSEIFTIQDPVLYLEDRNVPLTLVGTSLIQGNASLPAFGVKPGLIGRETYAGKNLVIGAIKRSGPKLPELEAETIKMLQFYSSNAISSAYEDISTSLPLKLVNSFKKKTKMVSFKEEVVLSNTSIYGNIIIRSEKLIRVLPSANLKDILLLAPTVEIADDVKGNFQVIATKTISVGKKCSLSYPSALTLLGSGKEKGHGEMIHIDSLSTIKGVVCYLNQGEDDENTAQIHLENNSEIRGEVYCEGSFQLSGKVSGCIFTRQFIVNYRGSVFKNYIYNGSIVNQKIPDKYGGILFKNSKKNIMEWLY